MSGPEVEDSLDQVMPRLQVLRPASRSSSSSPPPSSASSTGVVGGLHLGRLLRHSVEEFAEALPVVEVAFVPQLRRLAALFGVEGSPLASIDRVPGDQRHDHRCPESENRGGLL